MGEITVRIGVAITGSATDNGQFPAELAWDYSKSIGDNPRYYGDVLAKVIQAAADRAKAGAGLYCDLEDEAFHG
jgi:hypothetical protein